MAQFQGLKREKKDNEFQRSYTDFLYAARRVSCISQSFIKHKSCFMSLSSVCFKPSGKLDGFSQLHCTTLIIIKLASGKNSPQSVVCFKVNDAEKNYYWQNNCVFLALQCHCTGQDKISSFYLLEKTGEAKMTIQLYRLLCFASREFSMPVLYQHALFNLEGRQTVPLN